MNGKHLLASLRGLAGGIVGGVVGFYLYKWLISYGMFGPMIPGTLAGLGWGLASRHRSMVDAVLAAILALVCGVLSAWCTVRLGDDKSLSHFLLNITNFLTPPTMVMIGIGAVVAFFLGMGRASRSETTS